MRFSILILLSCASVCLGQAGKNWPASGGGFDGMRYSPLKQIDRANVAQLKLAWRWDSGDEYEGSEMQCNPLVIDGVVYATTPRMRVVALDGASGKLLWDFDPRTGKEVKGKHRGRGMTYWSDGARDRRIYVGIEDYLYALDLQTGKPVESFGDAGRVDLRQGLGENAAKLSVRANSPGVVYKDLLIMGSAVAEDLPAAPGHIRAYDVRTGRIRWTFRTIPQPGEFGYETWPPEAYKSIGGANSWAGLTLDEKRGLVFVPTGSAAFDFYGANRKGDNLFANCLLALRADTGERVWHFQFVKHDVWDRDLPTAPTLVRVKRGGKWIDAVAQITKSGHVWVFDRANGKSLFPFKEISVPASEADGEVLAAKQVLPIKPEPFARQQVTEELLTKRTPEAHKAVLGTFRRLKNGPHFIPPSKEGSIIFPGLDGGGEWGGGTWDPETGLFYVNSNEMAWILRLVPRVAASGSAKSLYIANCSGCHKPNLQGTPPEFPSLVNIYSRSTPEHISMTVRRGAGRMPGYSFLGEAAVDAILKFLQTGEDVQVSGPVRKPANDLKYRLDGYIRFEDPDQYPAVAPPWGTLSAIDLSTGNYKWKIPFGEIPALAEKGMRNTGSENYGGGVVTAGGLLFIAATNYDKKFRAFDKLSGKLLWETMLPAGGNATPSTYEVNGEQYVIIGAGGGKWNNPSGGSYLAYKLAK